MKFGPFQLLERIGSGGVADVFRASRPKRRGGERIYALKRMHRHFSEDPEWVDMFVTEAQITAELSHRNIVQVYEFGELDGYYYLAMEYVDGRDLAWLIDRLEGAQERIPTNFAVHIALEISGALAHAHDSRDFHGQPTQLIHRDVSPANILIAKSGEVKLVDFGIAKARRRAEETTQGKIKGKFAYMSPEQINGEEIDQRSDIFSLGIVLHEMLTGTGLFRSPSVATTINRIIDSPIHKPSMLNGTVPSELDEITLRALARDRTTRYQRTRELRNDLELCSSTITGEVPKTDLAAWANEIVQRRPIRKSQQPAARKDPSREAIATLATPRPVRTLAPEPQLLSEDSNPANETMPEFVAKKGKQPSKPGGPKQRANRTVGRPARPNRGGAASGEAIPKPASPTLRAGEVIPRPPTSPLKPLRPPTGDSPAGDPATEKAPKGATGPASADLVSPAVAASPGDDFDSPTVLHTPDDRDFDVPTVLKAADEEDFDSPTVMQPPDEALFKAPKAPKGGDEDFDSPTLLHSPDDDFDAPTTVGGVPDYKELHQLITGVGPAGPLDAGKMTGPHRPDAAGQEGARFSETEGAGPPLHEPSDEPTESSLPRLEAADGFADDEMPTQAVAEAPRLHPPAPAEQADAKAETQQVEAPEEGQEDEDGPQISSTVQAPQMPPQSPGAGAITMDVPVPAPAAEPAVSAPTVSAPGTPAPVASSLPGAASFMPPASRYQPLAPEVTPGKDLLIAIITLSALFVATGVVVLVLLYQ